MNGFPASRRNDTFNGLGEGGAFDGRFVGFWGAWGEETKTVRLYCPTEGNRDRIDYCNQELVCEDTGEILGAENSICDDDDRPELRTMQSAIRTKRCRSIRASLSTTSTRAVRG